MCRITVFTPTYNRAYCLHKCYESLKRQTCKDFEWLIIDDGSIDNTEELVNDWIQNTPEFSIRYIKKENGGLHTAYNEAIANITTELCVCVDSDDFMPDYAIQRSLSFWDEYGSGKYAGIVGLDYTTNNEIIGDPLPNQKSVNLIDLLTNKYNIKPGDRTNVVRTELYKKYAPMKVFPGEKNFNPHYLHLLISTKYDFLVLNENLKFVEYQENGMTNSMLSQYKNSPNSFSETRLLYLSFPNTTFSFKFRHTIHLVSSSLLAKKLRYYYKKNPHRLYTIFAFPFGVFLFLLIKCKA